MFLMQFIILKPFTINVLYTIFELPAFTVKWMQAVSIRKEK